MKFLKKRNLQENEELLHVPGLHWFYTIKYDDGRKYTVCGTVAFVYINQISKAIVDEAGKMIQIQHRKLLEE